MEDASSLRYGYLVHYYCLFCISINRGYTDNLIRVIVKLRVNRKQNACLIMRLLKTP